MTVCKICGLSKQRGEYPGPRGKTCSECRIEKQKEHNRNYNRKRPPETPERIAAKAQWFVDNKDRWDETLRKRRALKRNAEGSHTAQQWNDLLSATGHKCLACKRTDRMLTRDHVIPLVKGGSDYIINIQPLCKPCNSSKGTQIIDYRFELRTLA